MSTAYTLPLQPTREAPNRHPAPHIEIVSTRRQRKARPRVIYALVAVGGLFVILMAQLMISIVLSGGAYQISTLQAQQKNLARDQQTLTESLHVLESPQNLAARATGLGMVLDGTGAGWMRLSDGAILQAPTGSGSATTADPTAQALITNALLTPDVLAGEAATAKAPDPGTPAAGAVASGTPVAGVPAGSDTSGGIPSPTTH